jgi:hypothetical protein
MPAADDEVLMATADEVAHNLARVQRALAEIQQRAVVERQAADADRVGSSPDARRRPVRVDSFN